MRTDANCQTTDDGRNAAQYAAAAEVAHEAAFAGPLAVFGEAVDSPDPDYTANEGGLEVTDGSRYTTPPDATTPTSAGGGLPTPHG